MARNRTLLAEHDRDIAESVALNLEPSGYEAADIDDRLAVMKHPPSDHS